MADARRWNRSSGSFRRSLQLELLEARRPMAADLNEASLTLAADTDADGHVAPSDALVVINELNRSGPRGMPGSADHSPEARRMRRLDSDGDGHLAPLDALRVINRLNRDGAKQIAVADVDGGHGELVSDTQKANIQKLFRDLNAIRASSDVTCQQIVQLVRDVGRAVDGAVAPSAETLDKLTSDLTAALEDGAVNLLEIATLKSDLDAVLASANVPQEEIDALVADVQTIVTASGVTSEQLSTLLQDLKAIITEAQNPTTNDVPIPPHDHSHGGQHEHPAPGLPVLGRTLMELTHVAEHAAVPSELITKLRTDIQTALANATRPEISTVLTLVKDWRQARRDGTISDTEKATIHTDLVNLLASANVPTEAANNVIADIEAIFATFAVSG